MTGDTANFFDAGRRFEEPFANLAAGESHLYAVIGGPASGKTMLLEHLNTQFEEQDGTPRLIPVLIDLDQIPLTSLNSVDDALEMLLKQFRDRLKKAPYKLCALVDDVLKLFDRDDYLPAKTFSNAFAYMRDIAVTNLGEVRLVALIDNVDELVKLDIARDVFNSFHALFEDTRINGFLDLIMAGNDNLYRQLNEPGCVWSNHAIIHLLACLEPAEAQAFLRAKTEILLPAHIGLLIYAYSGGHPFLLQHFITELAEINDQAWDTVTTEMILDIVEEFPDHSARRRIDIWWVPNDDESEISHDAYRQLLEGRPDPETLAAHLGDSSQKIIPDRLLTLGATFKNIDDRDDADPLTNLTQLVDTTLAELGVSLTPEADWSTRSEALFNQERGLYNLLAFPFTNMGRRYFRKTVGQTSSGGYSYKSALDRLIYTGAVQITKQKNYIIQGQILVNQFQELSPKGRFSLIASLKKQIITLIENLNTLKEQKASYGGLDVPLHILNNIKETENELENARQQLAKLEVED